MRFVLMTRRLNWGEDRVMYYDAKGRLCSLLASWTNVPEEDLFAQASAGRSSFRTDDLLRLCALIGELQEQRNVK
ncbi:MAG: Transposon, orf1 [Candidatus Gallionella acididurans]|uniref:Transposon, orf1 n=1 Tax=Candidatus Gallionella acididurans TaxID=1796491 RepID=A0A139BSE8_9PROT|nr:MAG: Transposon, orf1 [Candidatus Gallionella acididurans]